MTSATTMFPADYRRSRREPMAKSRSKPVDRSFVTRSTATTVSDSHNLDSSITSAGMSIGTDELLKQMDREIKTAVKSDKSRRRHRHQSTQQPQRRSQSEEEVPTLVFVGSDNSRPELPPNLPRRSKTHYERSPIPRKRHESDRLRHSTQTCPTVYASKSFGSPNSRTDRVSPTRSSGRRDLAAVHQPAPVLVKRSKSPLPPSVAGVLKRWTSSGKKMAVVHQIKKVDENTKEITLNLGSMTASECIAVGQETLALEDSRRGSGVPPGAFPIVDHSANMVKIKVTLEDKDQQPSMAKFLFEEARDGMRVKLQ